MKILSIDVGIKNLAYCLFDIKNNKTYDIISWGVTNIGNTNKEYKCCSIIKKQKKTTNNICNKKARYEKNNKYYCKTHAKCGVFSLPTQELSISKLNKIKKMKLQDLYKIMYDYEIPHVKNVKKIVLVDQIKKYVNENFYNYIEKKKPSNSPINLVTLGVNLKREFDVLFKNHDISNVLIENQIGPLANRMKSIQGMITQYFIMNNITNIEYISAMNKLKLFNIKNKLNYIERKKMGISLTLQILNKEQFNKESLNIFENSKKKDDLADSFLQCIWYLKSKNLINMDISKLNI
jgi:hypothetical protein